MVLFVSAFLLSLAWLTADHFPPWISWHNEIGAFAAVLWAFGFLLVRHHDKLRRPVALPKLMWPLAVLCVVVVIQAIAGNIVFSGDAWVLVFYLATCAFALAFGLALSAIDEYPFGDPSINSAGRASNGLALKKTRPAPAMAAPTINNRLFPNLGTVIPHWLHRCSCSRVYRPRLHALTIGAP